ncbi:MAG: HAMP domain-containing protein [Bacteroidetes bacterium]|nr:HAMP domain-containing protein [Bacteroidota bacterium]
MPVFSIKWFQRLPAKLAILFYITFALTVIVFAIVSIWAVRENTYRSVRESLVYNANFWRAFLLREQDAQTPAETENTVLTRFSAEFGIRLSLIDSVGTVIYDSSFPTPGLLHLENHLHRPEIIQSMSEPYGEDIRKSTSVDISQFYVARMLGESIPLNGIGRVKFIRVSYALNTLNDYYLTYITGIVIVSVLLLIGGIIIYKYLADRFAEPVLEMVNVARKITRGDLQERIAVTSSDELGFLGKSINMMAEKLVDDIRQLKKLERVRSEFLANVSHELKTPIFTIQGFVETLLDGAMEDEEVNRTFLLKIHKNSLHLNNLVSDLIEISRIETGELKMNLALMDLRGLIEEVVEDLKPRADDKELILKTEFTPGPTEIWADRSRLFQVFTNLVDNAIKYTDTGSVTIRTDPYQSGEIRVSISDTGPGISPEHLSRIFERFYRVDKHRSKDLGGTGLGLAIVKHILEAHHSHIRVESVVGKGTTFSFILRQEAPVTDEADGPEVSV